MDFDKQLENIVRRCMQGRRCAFEELFEIYQPRLKYYVRRLSNDTHTDDLLQDIWMAVIKKIGKLKAPGAFSVWLYRIARNKVFDSYKRKDIFVALDQEHDIAVSTEDEPTFDAEDAQQLHKAMNELKPYHKEVLTLCFIEQMSYQSIAEVVDCSIGTVRSRIYYAKKSLRKEMERQNG